MARQWVSTLLGILLVGACSGTTTQNLLDSDFVTRDTSKATLLAPNDKAVLSQSPTFSWSAREGADEYTIQVSETSDFTTVLVENKLSSTTYTLENAEFSTLGPLRHYWRVTTSYVADELISVTSDSFSFDLLDQNNIYVNATSTEAKQVGNKTAPFKTIQSAIEDANTRRGGDKNVAMNVLVAQGTHTEEVQMRAGISILGGYEAAGWTRNIAANTTTIQALTDTAVRGNSTIKVAYTTTTLVEGFTINGGSVAGDSSGIHLEESHVTVANNTINGGSGGQKSYGVSVNGSSAVAVIRNNVINGGTSPASSSGVFVNNMDPLIYDNRIEGGSGPDSRGVRMTGGANAQIYRNTIFGGSGTAESRGITEFGCTTLIYNNSIHGGTGPDTNGLRFDSTVSMNVYNNTILSGNGTSKSYAIYATNQSTSTFHVRNNILFNDGTGTRYGFAEAFQGDPDSVRNNNFFDLPGGAGYSVYFDNDANCSANNDGDGNDNTCNIADMEGLIDITANGNVAIDNAGAQLFIDIDGAGNDINDVTDNDWQLQSPALATCNVLFGGIDGVAGGWGFSEDKNNTTRTGSLPSAAPCTGNVTNANAAGWSMGAYETD